MLTNDRRLFYAFVVSGVLAVVLVAALTRASPFRRTSAAEGQAPMKEDPLVETVHKSESEWREELTKEEFHILREKGTERPGTSGYVDAPGTGLYVCAACGHPLFETEDQFHSGTGWPSYTRPATATSVLEFEDRSWGMSRTEIVCRRCGGHLGHVFTDGPPPTGLRYCINGVALDFRPGESAPADTPMEPETDAARPDGSGEASGQSGAAGG
jgi:peptide-methionine (R)-S-oxide reductase